MLIRGPPLIGALASASVLDLTEAMLRQRACRRYLDDPVDDAVILEMLDLACHAPSSENLQPWRFVVVRDADRRAALAELMRQLWEAGGRKYAQRTLDTSLFDDVDDGFRGGGLASAPVMIVVAGDTSVVPRPQLPASVFPAIQNLLLAATAHGLGSCLTTIATFRADDVRALVGFPETIDPLAIVPVGYPARALGRSRRAPAASKTFLDDYHQPWTDQA